MTPAAPQSNEAGFGLIELLIAMVILNVALLAIVSAFSSASIGVARAARVGTAGAIADRQMEQYRAIPYGSIGILGAGTTDATYRGDAVGCPGGTNGNPPCGEFSLGSSCPVVALTGAQSPCTMMVNVTGPDGHNYRLDTYVKRVPATGDQRATKTVLIIVRDAAAKQGGLPVLARESSTFDCSTGGGAPFNSGNADC